MSNPIPFGSPARELGNGGVPPPAHPAKLETLLRRALLERDERVLAEAIRRMRPPMHRVAMDKKAREMTVTNAFEVVRPKLIEGRSILLVDDIFTSGATVSYCAKALKKKGAAIVKVFTLARAL